MARLVFDNRQDALIALKALHIDELMQYRRAWIRRGLRGYCVEHETPRRWYRSPLTVLAVADGFEVPRRQLYTVTCGVCYRDFETDSQDAAYCSAACKQKAYRKRIKAERSA